MKKVVKKTKTFFEMIKFEHSVFALPFAYLGVMFASRGLPTLKIFILVTLAMVAARTFGMTINRLIDREIDCKNPRTKNRSLPAGKLSVKSAWIAALVSLVVFMASIAFLPKICWLLSPIVLVTMWIYPYLKRITWCSHLFLGLILSIAPVGGWLAVTGSFSLTPIILALGVATWVAGFDILYALQDYHFDKENNLFSIPVKWGHDNALKISQWLHIVTIISFALVLFMSSVGVWAWAGMVIVASIIIREHRILAGLDLSKIESAFFVSNAWVSIVFFLGVLIDFSF